MRQTYDTVDYDWLTKPTGDPFVDAGGYALEEFSQHFPDLDILQLIDKAADIYVDTWSCKINAFFLNSPITQPAFIGNQKKVENNKYFSNVLANKYTPDTLAKIGECRITGRKTYVFPCGRHNSVLSGSTAFINFHHGFQNGLMVSKEILIRYFFLPLACEQLQGQIGLISSSNPEIATFFSKRNCRMNLDYIGKHLSNAVLKARTSSSGTTLFRFADSIIRERKSEFDDMDSTLTLYNFTNFGASPSLTIYELPFQVLKFYNYVIKEKHRAEWTNFVKRYYKDRKATFDEASDKFLIKDKGKTLEVGQDEYQYWYNVIYDSLMQDKSILGYLVNFCREHDFDFSIVRMYSINIRNMKKDTIDKIEQMADFIISSNDEVGIGKAIRKLDAVASSYDLRRFILKDIVAKYYEEGNEDAIVTVNDYAEYLFPDTNSWRETRDVLIIALYERLHKMHKQINIESDTTND